MSYVYTADPSMLNQRARLVAPNRPQLPTHVQDVEPSAWDHVVRTLDDFPAPVGSTITLTEGSWAIAGAVALGGNTLVVPAATTVLMKGLGWDKNVSATGVALQVAGTAMLETLSVESTGIDGIQMTAATSELVMSECHVVAANQCVELRGVFARVIGGLFEGTDAFRIVNDLERLQLVGVEASPVTGSMLTFGAGAVTSVIVDACVMYAALGSGIVNGGAAPSQGLSVVGNVFDCPFPFSGFTAASARVNAKANIDSAGLMSETAIVP